MEETWKVIIGYPNYKVSNMGNVSGKNGKKISKCKRGNYFAINLYKNNKRKTFNVHRLVAESFIPNTENKRCVNHTDSNTLNNNVSNLEWATHKENVQHAYRLGRKKHGKGEQSSNFKLKDTEILEIKRLFKDGLRIKDIVPLFNVSQPTISRVILNKQRVV